MINYIPHSPTVKSTNDALELRAIEYFQTRTASELAGHFNPEFWSRYLLRTAQCEPAIRHAVVALGAIHEHFEGGSDPHATVAGSYGMQHYGMAIRHVLDASKSNAPQSIDLALVSCILFTCFESLQGHYKSALTHTHSGLRVLREREVNGDVRMSTGIPSILLKSLYTRLETQTMEIGDVAFDIDSEIDTQLYSIPPAFSTLDEAQCSVEQLRNRLCKIFEAANVIAEDRPDLGMDTVNFLKASHGQLVKDYHAWCAAFEAYLALEFSSNVKTDRFLRTQPKPGVLVLQIWRIVGKIMLHPDFMSGEMMFDQFIDDAKAIVDLAESFINQTSTPAKPDTRQTAVRVRKVKPSNRQAEAISAPDSEINTEASQDNWRTVPYGFRERHPSVAPVRCEDNGTIFSSSDTMSWGPPAASSKSGGSAADRSHMREIIPIIAPEPPTILKPTFSLSVGIITPLYVCVTRCRDPIIRRRALRLLHKCNRKEGVWDSRLSARVAQRIVEIEEAGAIPADDEPGDVPFLVTSAVQIPESSRVRELEAIFLPGRQGKIRYRKSSGKFLGRAQASPQHLEELLEW